VHGKQVLLLIKPCGQALINLTSEVSFFGYIRFVLSRFINSIAC
jgi:hypothetical protein